MIEQGEGVAAVLAKVLEGEGYRVVTAADTLSGLKRIYEEYPDLIIMEKELPSEKGEDPTLRIRLASYIPLIVLGREDQMVEMLELGADVYMRRPLNLKELVARIRSLLRLKGKNTPPKDETGAPDEGNDDCSGLTPAESHLAGSLGINRRGTTGSLAGFGGAKKVTLNTLRYYIRRLRRKLADTGIMSVRRTGYGLRGKPGPTIFHG